MFVDIVTTSGVTGGGAGEAQCPLAAFTGLAKQSRIEEGEERREEGKRRKRRGKRRKRRGEKEEIK